MSLSDAGPGGLELRGGFLRAAAREALDVLGRGDYATECPAVLVDNNLARCIWTPTVLEADDSIEVGAAARKPARSFVAELPRW